MNIRVSEYVKLIEMVELYGIKELESNVEGSEEDFEDDNVPPSKRHKTETTNRDRSTTTYSWEYINPKTGEQQIHSNYVYLNYETCSSEAESCKPTVEEGILQINTIPDLIPTSANLIVQVHDYLLRQEFALQIVARCVGCKRSCQSQKDHMSDRGCMSETEDLIDFHAVPCHLRISAQRLVNACGVMSAHYKTGGATYAEAMRFIRTVDPVTILKSEVKKPQVYELNDLDDM